MFLSDAHSRLQIEKTVYIVIFVNFLQQKIFEKKIQDHHF